MNITITSCRKLKKIAEIKMAFLHQIKKKPKIKKFLIIFEPVIDFNEYYTQVM